MNQTNNQDSASFGRYLKGVRMEKRVSLEQIAEETRVGLNTLLLIESEDLDKLPAEVFTKGFLRAYAKAIGADGDRAVEQYLSDLRSHQEAVKTENELFRSGSKFWTRLLSAFFLLGCIIAGSIYVLNGFRFYPPTSEIRHHTAPTQPEAVEEETQPTAPETTSKAAAVGNQTDKLRLRVVAVKETWMKVIIDGQDSEQFQLGSGDRLELVANKGFNLLIGDAKGVELTLNEKPVKISGKDGQVVTVEVP